VLLKRFSIVILSAGMFLGVAPVVASAHEGHGDGRRGDRDHYQCWYHCRGDYYYRRGDRHDRYCWYRDRDGWYRARCYRHSSYDDYGDGWYRDHRDHD
jgi:hypothetical protein